MTVHHFPHLRVATHLAGKCMLSRFFHAEVSFERRRPPFTIACPFCCGLEDVGVPRKLLPDELTMMSRTVDPRFRRITKAGTEHRIVSDSFADHRRPKKNLDGQMDDAMKLRDPRGSGEITCCAGLAGKLSSRYYCLH